MGYAARGRRMMMRVITFEGDQASTRFDVCWMALHVGRIMLLNDVQSRETRDERRRDMMLVRAFRSASDEAPPEIGKLQTGDKQRVVKSGSSFPLQQIDLDRLLTCINRVGWGAGKLDIVEETIDWLQGAPTTDTRD